MSHSCLSSLSEASTIKHIFHHHSSARKTSASFSTLTSDFSLISCINMLPFCTRKILLLLQKLSMQSAVQQEACTALCAREKVEAAHETCRGVRSAGCGPEQPAAPPPLHRKLPLNRRLSCIRALARAHTSEQTAVSLLCQPKRTNQPASRRQQ